MRRLLLVLAISCGKSDPTPVATPPAIATGDSVAVAAPKADDRPKVKPTKTVPWQKPARAPNDQEALLAGTWVAKVGDYATRSSLMDGKVMLQLGANPDLVTNVMDAIEHDNKMATNCIWLELRPDFTGFRRECAVVNGQPSALDQNDLTTGAKKDFGTKLEWMIDTADKNTLKIHFADDMLVPAKQGDKLVSLVFRTWYLQLDKADKAAGDSAFLVKETIPEHGYAVPTEYTYTIASGTYLP